MISIDVLGIELNQHIKINTHIMTVATMTALLWAFLFGSEPETA